MFARLGSWCFRQRKLVAIAWLIGIVVVGSISGAVGGKFGQDFTAPDFESTRGLDILEEEFGGQGAGVQGTIVFQAGQGVTDPAVQEAMEQTFGAITALAEDPELDVRSTPALAHLDDDALTALEGSPLELLAGITLVSPYEEAGARQVATRPEVAGTIAFAQLEIPGDDWEEAGEIGRTLEHLLPAVDGLQVELGGGALGEFEEPSAEILGLAFATIILVVAFGSVLAMGLPIGVALAGIIAGSMVVTVLSNLIEMPDFAPFLGIMIGLGVGIDYALLIVTRYRENLHHGHSPEEATAIAIDTAGRSVAFAGVTVVISFLGMLVMGVAFIQGLAISAAVVVAMTVVASLTLLPALLGFAGERVEVTRWRGIVATGFVALGLVGVGLKAAPLMVGFPLAIVVLALGFAVAPLRKELRRRPPRPLRETFAYRWSRFIQRNPWPAAIGGALLLLVLSIPVLGLRLGFSDEGNFAEGTTTREAYDLLAEGFGPGFNGPFFLATQLEGPADPDVLAGITDAVAADPGVAFVSPPIPAESGQAFLWQVTPTSSPQDAETTALVNRLRDDVLDEGEAALGAEVAVTGQVPSTVDFSELLSSRMPFFFAAVLVLSFLLLMLVFRSLLVPLKAVIMNLLSIGAAYGIMVALVQWGWFSDLTGLAPGPIETFAPMMLFAIVFGLSMDYEVFLLSRIKEEYVRTGDSHTSVANGLAATARVITAAAAIMVFIFGAFLLENDRTFKLFGVGLATAIFLDATVVRMLLVPATMELLGDRNWWLPRWLDRILPTINVEGTPDTAAAHEELDDLDEPELASV
ncbi:MAG: MMPL family transporter [Acidimicrobiales bacterium]